MAKERFGSAPAARRLAASALLAVMTLASVVGSARASDGFFADPALEETPEIVFRALDGEERSLSDYRGEALVLNLWATWCAPCRAEMPSLEALSRRYREEGAPIRVLALSLDRGPAEKIERFLEEIGVEDLEIVQDPTMREGRKLATRGLPTTIVFDANGVERARKAGEADWAAEEAIEAIAAALE